MPGDRLSELRSFAKITARELRDRARSGQSREEPNLLVLGDFNIDRREEGMAAVLGVDLDVPDPFAVVPD